MEYIIKIKDKKVYEALLAFLKSMKVQVDGKSEKEQENAEWKTFAKENLSRAYSDDEPDYTENMVKEPNPVYERR